MVLKFEAEKLGIAVVHGEWDKVVSLDDEDRARLRQADGGEAIASYLENTGRFEVMRHVLVSHEGIGEGSTERRKKALDVYLRGLRAVALPNVAEHGFEEFDADTIRGFVSGHIRKDRVVVDLYCKDSRRFLVLVLTDAGCATMEDVYSLLGKIRVNAVHEQ